MNSNCNNDCLLTVSSHRHINDGDDLRDRDLCFDGLFKLCLELLRDLKPSLHGSATRPNQCIRSWTSSCKGY